ncbi:hypothetical protein RHMOL_Rhmol01G0362300 [Rhododendron molle]|uniref:Uncharacterized protein n=1 Tax=Rhododendron molle TaxID=49168 RepID=A0ACC0Q933_RHOML|nr:hypothetical protein RHMOL_Rhmol01G0362300 [Rhododendron molle]
MELAKRSVVLVLLMVALGGVASTMGEVYKVGEANGWTNTAQFNYKAWAAAKTFHVGDTIRRLLSLLSPFYDPFARINFPSVLLLYSSCSHCLFQYNKQFQNVVRVTHKNFNACNATTQYRTLSTGNDSFVIPRQGHFYFICSLPGHCQSGQKVDIRVPEASPPPSQAPTSSLSPSPSPSDSDHKSASALPLAKGGFWLSAVVLALSVSGFAY